MPRFEAAERVGGAAAAVGKSFAGIEEQLAAVVVGSHYIALQQVVANYAIHIGVEVGRKVGQVHYGNFGMGEGKPGNMQGVVL